MSDEKSISASVTALLQRINAPEINSDMEVIDRVHEVLRSIAASHVRQEHGTDVGVTEVVNQAYLRVFGSGSPRFENRRHFFAAFNTAVSRLLIEQGRRRNVERRALSRIRQRLISLDAGAVAAREDLVDLAASFPELEARDPRAAEVARLKCLSGISDQEIAEMLEISPRTVQRDWLFARSFLLREIESGDDTTQSRGGAEQ